MQINILIQKLDEFIRKYYLNQLIRGALYTVGIGVGMFVAAALIENLVFNHTSPSQAVFPRKVLFFSYILTTIGALVYWVLIPLFHYFKLGKVISHEQAAGIVGTHFTEVKDKLLNVLQLKKQADEHPDASLLLASIEQKTVELSPVPFKKAIDLSKNKKYLRFALPPLLLLLFLLIAAPGLIPGSANRLLHNQKEYEPEAPFGFVLENPTPQVPQFEDYTMTVKAVGKELPAEAFIVMDNYTYKLIEQTPGVYTFTFNKVAKDTEFRFRGAGVESKAYTLDVLEKPNIVNFEVMLDYPSYTGRADEQITNIGDLVIPAGTNIVWTFNVQHTDFLNVKFGNAETSAERTDEDMFVVKRQIRNDELYKLFVSNKNIPRPDSVAYSLTVIPDLYPTITAEKFEDSLNRKVIYFAGEAGDDYGIRSLSFNYKIDKGNAEGAVQSTPLKTDGKQTAYSYTFDTQNLDLKPGDKVSYYFEVFDNDGVNGSKSTRTQTFTYAIPSVDELEKQEATNNKEIKDNLEDAFKKAEELREKAKKLQEELLQKKELDWQDRKKMEQLIAEQKKLEEQMKNAQQNMKENLENQKQFQQPNEELLKKQEQLQKMFDEVLNDEMKEMFKKMEELLQQLDKKDIMQELEEMKFNEDQVSKELDRMKEMFKELEFEKTMKDAIDKLDSLAKDQEKLSDDTREDKKSEEEIKKEQERIEKEFEKVQEKLDDAKEKNEELEDKKEMKDTKQEEEDIKKDMQDSKKQMNQKQKSGASKSQKKASDKMKSLANQLAMQMQSQESEQAEEDMKALRQLLENLVSMSYDQERLMKKTTDIIPNTPSYVTNVQEQYKIKDDFRIVEDSLHELSKRVFQLETFITDKVTEVKKRISKSIDELEERRKDQATVHQQYTMTGLNDLALMLAEALDQMQQQAASQMEGTQMCQKPGNKPGKGKKSGKGKGDMQKDLNQQMKDLQDQLKNGKTPNGMSKGFAQMAAKQAAIRKMLEQMQKEKQQQGQGGDKGLQEMIDKMNKTETELVNKQLSEETLKRQEEILTRLLESDRAERERDKDEKRESHSATDMVPPVPPALEEYLKKRQAQIDLYKTSSPNLKPYYRGLVEDYFNSLKN